MASTSSFATLLFACGALCVAACFIDVPASREPGAGGAGGVAATTPGAGGTGGAVGCGGGLADCDGDGTCETDITNDNDNCAACGRSCLGASCVDTRCQPIELRPGQTFPHQIAVGESNIYWTNGGENTGNSEVLSASLTGSAPRTLVSMAGKARGLALDDTFVFWVDSSDGSLHRVPRDGMGADQMIVAGPGMSGGTEEAGVVVAGDLVYWSFESGGLIRVSGKDGNGAMDLATMQPDPRQLAVLDGVVYFTVGNDPELRSVPIGGGTVSIHTSDPELTPVNWTWGVTVADGFVFFRASDWGAGLAGRVVQFNPSDEAMTLFAETPGAKDITADATHLYFTSDEENTVARVPLAGGDVTVLATGQDNPTGIAVDDEAVYWTNRALGVPGGGSIMKVAK